MINFDEPQDFDVVVSDNDMNLANENRAGPEQDQSALSENKDNENNDTGNDTQNGEQGGTLTQMTQSGRDIWLYRGAIDEGFEYGSLAMAALSSEEYNY